MWGRKDNDNEKDKASKGTNGDLKGAEEAPQVLHPPPYSSHGSINFHNCSGGGHLRWIDMAPPWRFFNFHPEPLQTTPKAQKTEQFFFLKF